LYSFTNALSFLCSRVLLEAGGLAASAFNSRCIRSCLSFCSGSEYTGRISCSRSQTANEESRASDVEQAKGKPLSEWICSGVPYFLKILINTAFVASKVGCSSAWAANKYLLYESAIVKGHT